MSLDSSVLVKLARSTMPFGRYEGWPICDLPEPYLLWYSQQGFPSGELGSLLAQMLELRVNGLESLLKPLRTPGFSRPPPRSYKR